MKQYKLSHQDQELGSFTIAEIVAKVRARELELFDYIFDEEKNDWVLLMEFPELAHQLKSQKPPKPPKPSEVRDHNEPASKADEEVPVRLLPRSEHDVTDWYILKGEHRFGPFDYQGVIRMLQEKIVFSFDWIWHSGLENWVRIQQLPDFQPQTLRHLQGTERTQAFTKRQFKRHKVEARVLVHDQTTLWKGQAREISLGGMSVALNSHLLIPGQKLTVHFKSTGKIPAFNAECEVISKSFEPDPTQTVEYGLKFVGLTRETQDSLRQHVA